MLNISKEGVVKAEHKAGGLLLQLKISQYNVKIK